MEQNIIYQISSTELDKYISIKVAERMESYKPVIKEEVEYLTRKEVCELLRISLVTLNKNTNKDILKAYRIGARVLYNKKEVLESFKTKIQK
jgi:excisionase family DNA binding protein